MNHFIKQIRPSRVFGRPHKQLLSQRSWERSMTKSGFDFYDGPIVISGISGRFPMSSNMEELKKNLFDGLEMTSSAAERWRGELQPARFGFLDCLDQFDTSFFNMTPRLAHQVDPQLRLLLEVVFEAILDAGINPTELRGSRVGVFCASLGGEAVDYDLIRYNPDLSGYGLLMKANFMLPGWISFAFDLQGPSIHVSTACSSSLTSIEAAVNSIAIGKCDAAIIAGSNALLNPHSQIDLIALNALAMDGRSKAFDASADGFARAEAAVGILIQKQKDARRRYATIRDVRSNSDGFKFEGLMSPSGRQQELLLKEAYERAGVDPAKVSYIEAHGTGTPTGDPQEIEAIHKVFCESPARERPLLLGSVKSNMGHTESVAGLCSVAKAIIAIQEGSIPANLHFRKPKPEQEHLFDGSFKIVTEATPFNRGMVGISSFGISGTNAHMILEPGPTSSKTQAPHELPVLIPFSGRKEDQVFASIEEASANAQNPEFLSLLHTAFRTNIPGHPFRGIGLLKPGDTTPEITVANSDSAGPRPLWIAFPGMGSQWNEMGKDLMKIEPFSESVKRSMTTLRNLGIDLDDLLKAKNEAIFNDIHYAVMAITSMQIALWDTLKELNVTPEGFIGHSTGEFLCAYADGCLSAEETLLVTDARGRAFKESRKVVGCMASVGMSAEEIKARLPPGVELACNNAAQNVTVSGELEAVTKFVKELEGEGKHAVVVKSCGIAAHSQHVQDAADLLKKYVAGIITGDRVRSSRWISTSVPESDWETPLAKYASPEYFDHNLRSPVLFYEALQHVPPKALVVEISPNGFFQALLKDSVPTDCVHVAPMNVRAADKLLHLYQSVGDMYLSGVDVQMDRLYPPVSLPVSSTTPSISPLVKWKHDQPWKTHALDYPVDLGRENVIDLLHPNHAGIVGHKVEDRILYPATGYIYLAWAHYAENLGQRPETTPVVLNNVDLKRATILDESEPATLVFKIQDGTGNFEFCYDGQVAVTGTVGCLPENTTHAVTESPREDSTWIPLNTRDIYKELRLRGYNYSGEFQGIRRIDNEGKWAELAWTGNWISFLDTMLQPTLLSNTSRNMAVPLTFESISIDPVAFMRSLQEPAPGSEHPIVRVTVHPNQNKVTCPGIEIKGVTATILATKGQRGNLAFEKHAFCPYVETSSSDLEPHMWEIVDLVLENNQSKGLKVVDVFTDGSNSLAGLFRHILTLKPSWESDLRMLTLTSVAEGLDDKFKEIGRLQVKDRPEQLVPEVAADLLFLDDPNLLNSVAETVKPGGFLLFHSQTAVPDQIPRLTLVSRKTLPNMTLALFRKTKDGQKSIAHVPINNETELSWMSELQGILEKPAEETSRIYVTAQSNSDNGILGLVTCLRQEEGGERIRCIFDPEKKLNLNFGAPDSTLQSIIDKDLAVNVFKNNTLGSYRHVPLEAQMAGVIKEVEHAYVSPLTPGDLSSLRWIESPLGTNPPPPQNETGNLYRIAYAAMNFRDALLATKTIPIEPQFSYKGSYIGYEFSGYDENGNRVMGLSNGSAFASSVISTPRFIWQVPPIWTLEQAATVPMVYITVLYAFHIRGRIAPGQSVLIHAGTGGVGQAAISVALAHGCEVFTTVGTPEKRDFIKKHFPTIPDDHIGNSRDTSFEAQFMEVTHGRGVNVVLNSLAEDKLMATVRCLAVNGKFLDIGIYDAYKNTPLGMRPFLKNIEFHGIELYHMQQEISFENQFSKLMNDGIESGAVRPLPSHVFERDQIQEAFQFMANAKQMGKILIKVRDEIKPAEPLNIPAIGRCYFSRDKTYVIVGGLGGLGLEVANWMVERGARHLILTSRSGIRDGYQSLCLRKWGLQGVRVETPIIDLGDKEAADSFLKELAAKQKVGGIFNSALVLHDALFPNQTFETFQEACVPKSKLTANLDVSSRKYCPDLDYFVVFSSAACGRGSSGQANYGWANSVTERICENRMADGLHGLAIQWGVIGQVGFVQERFLENTDGSEVLFGTLPQTVESCLEVLDTALQQNFPVVSSAVVAGKGVKKSEAGELLARLMNMFGVKDVESLSPSKKLSELGMDSLVALELGQTLKRDYDLHLSKTSLRSLTINDLKSIELGTFTVGGKGKRRNTDIGINTTFKLHDECLVKLKSCDDSMQTVFIVHGIGGSAELFKPLAAKLDANVYGFQFREYPGEISIPALAESYIAELKKVKPTGPYTIMGHSAGCSIGFEMVLQLLTKHNDTVSSLTLMDGCPTWIGANSEQFLMTYFAIKANAEKFFGNLLVPKQSEGSTSHDAGEDSQERLRGANEEGFADISKKALQRYLLLGNAIANYTPKQDFDGQTLLIKAKTKSHLSPLIPNEDYNVSLHCKGAVSRYEVEGDHESFLEEENVEETARILNELLKNTRD